MSKNILLTGYSPFDQFASNPSGEVVQVLNGRELGDYTIRGAIMPVDCRLMPQILSNLMGKYEPVIVIGLGLAFSESGIRIERVSHNWLAIASPDNGGHTPDGEPIIQGGQTTYKSTIPTKEIVSHLLHSGIPAYTSEYAGSHLCNQMFYLAAHLAGGKAKCGYIHLPASPKLVAANLLTNKTATRTPSMSLDTTTTAIELALKFIITTPDIL